MSAIVYIRTEEDLEAERKDRQRGKYKDERSQSAPGACLQATYCRGDKVGVILDVAVTTGQTNEGEMMEPQVDEVQATTGTDIKTVTADAGYAYAKVYGALERRGIGALIPTKAEPIRSPVPLRGGSARWVPAPAP
jgi:uncharacterized protein YggE